MMLMRMRMLRERIMAKRELEGWGTGECCVAQEHFVVTVVADILVMDCFLIPGYR